MPFPKVWTPERQTNALKTYVQLMFDSIQHKKKFLFAESLGTKGAGENLSFNSGMGSIRKILIKAGLIRVEEGIISFTDRFKMRYGTDETGLNKFLKWLLPAIINHHKKISNKSTRKKARQAKNAGKASAAAKNQTAYRRL